MRYIQNTYGVAIGMETQAPTYDINVGVSGKNQQDQIQSGCRCFCTTK